MSVSFQLKLGRSRGAVEPERLATPEAPPAVRLVNWRAARRAARACCCPAQPVVVAVMPPVPGREHQTELLLCGHRYRASWQALAPPLGESSST